MSNQVSPEVHARALEAAENLRRTLAVRLIGSTAPAWSCTCGATGSAASRVVGIRIPQEYHNQIGMFKYWTCSTVDHRGRPGIAALSNFIPRGELFAIFGNAFAGIDVEVLHPEAKMFLDDPEIIPAEQVPATQRKFSASGHKIRVSHGNKGYVRPSGDLTISVWRNAVLSVCTILGSSAKDDQALGACYVDPFAFGQRERRGVRQYFDFCDPAELPTLYIPILGHGKVEDLYIPIARLVKVDDSLFSAVTFELDASVEEFEGSRLSWG
jgi:hypothetical protein